MPVSYYCNIYYPKLIERKKGLSTRQIPLAENISDFPVLYDPEADYTLDKIVDEDNLVAYYDLDEQLIFFRKENDLLLFKLKYGL